MKKEFKRENLPASSLRTFEKKFESVEKEQISALDKLEVILEGLSKKIDNSVDVNIKLQMKIAELTANVATIADSLKFGKIRIPKSDTTQETEKTPSVEEQMSPSIEPVANIGRRPDLTSQMKELVQQNRMLTDTLKELESQLKKTSTRDSIKRALEKSSLK